MVQDGRAKATHGYRYDELRGVIPSGEWLPARVASGAADDFVPGYMNLPEWYFSGKTKASRAPADAGGVIYLDVTPTLVIYLQVQGGK